MYGRFYRSVFAKTPAMQKWFYQRWIDTPYNLPEGQTQVVVIPLYEYRAERLRKIRDEKKREGDAVYGASVCPHCGMRSDDGAGGDGRPMITRPTHRD